MKYNILYIIIVSYLTTRLHTAIMNHFTDVILLFNTDSTTLEKVWDEVVSIIDGEELDELSDDKTVKIANLITQATDDDDEKNDKWEIRLIEQI